MISVVTASIRPEFLPILAKCINRQTFTSYEWLVGAPQRLFTSIDREVGHDIDFVFVAEPPPKDGDYYGLDRCWNSLFKQAKGELIVVICDGQWFPPDTLEKLWDHYEANPKAIVGAVGDQYDQVIDGKPEHMVWRDPRKRTDMGSFYETLPTEPEWTIVSFPKQAIFDIGGLDEKYDQGAALGEKEANFRMEKAGYKSYLDQSIEYRAIHHPRLSAEWDKKYKIASEMYLKDVREVIEGRRLKLTFLP